MGQAAAQKRAPGLALDDAAREHARLALVAMLAEGPVHKLAMREAADRAGLGLATLYKYFGGKEQMVLAVLDPEIDALIEAMAEASRREVGVKARFGATLKAITGFAARHKAASRALWLNLPAGLWSDENWRARQRAVFEQIFKSGLRDGSVRDDIAVDQLASHIVGASDRVIERTLHDGSDPRTQADLLVRSLWPMVSSD